MQSYFQNDPLVKFSEFDGDDFGKKIIYWLNEPSFDWQIAACQSAARVRTELDWQPLCSRAIDFVEKIESDVSIDSGGDFVGVEKI